MNPVTEKPQKPFGEGNAPKAATISEVCRFKTYTRRMITVRTSDHPKMTAGFSLLLICVSDS